jgi:hypothetical protein
MESMLDLTAELLPELERAQPAAAGLGEGITWPAYGGLSIANLPAAACAWLGVDAPSGAAPALHPRLQEHWGREFNNVILLLVDGFGLNMLQKALAQGWDALPTDAVLAPLTSVVPSTTAAALTSLWTGALPAEHGVIGYEVFLKEYSLIANMLTHNPASYATTAAPLSLAGFDPSTFLPVPTLGPHLAGQNVQPYAFIHRSIANSSLSNLLHGAAVTSPILSLTDLFVSLDQLLNQSTLQKRYIYVYWSSLDDLSHRYGPDDPRVLRETALFIQQLGLFLADRQAKGSGDTLFLLAADHGHISTPPNPAFEVRSHPELLDCLVMLPSGEARLPFLFARSGREERLLAYIQRTWGSRFRVVSSAQFIASRLLGNRGQAACLPDRLGDFVVLPEEGAYWYFGYKDNLLRGRHGGLSRTEMLVPLLSIAL